MKKMILIAGIMGFAACTEAPLSDPKIVGGRAATVPYDFFVGLYDASYTQSSFCGGALVAHDVVVTAAHCVSTVYDTLQVGIALKSNKNPGPDQLRKVKAVQIHPNYDDASNGSDIALLFLESKPQDETQLKTISLNANESWPAPSADVRVIGHGNTSSYGWLEAPTLQEVDVPVVSNSICKTAYPDLEDSMICAGLMVDGGKDSCQGDSGGPLFTSGLSPQLVGIVSYGNGCAQKAAPGVYTRVSSFAPWIQAQIAAYRQPPVPTLQNLAALVKNYCYVPAVNTFNLQADDDLLSFEDRLLTDLSAITSLPEGETWPAIQAREALVEIQSCAFSLSNGHSVEVIQAKKEGITPEYRGFVKLDEKWFVVKNKQTQSFSYSCQDANAELKTVTGFVDSSSYGPWLWNVQIENESYDTWSFEGEPLDVIEAHSCSVQDYALKIYRSGSELFAKYQKGDAAATWFQLWKSEFSSEVNASMKPISAQVGVLEITNDGWSDIFTWKLACDFNFSLKDRFGMIHDAQHNGRSWEILFDYPGAFNAAIAMSYSRTFTMKVPDIMVTDLPAKSCQINGRKLAITLDSEF